MANITEQQRRLYVFAGTWDGQDHVADLPFSAVRGEVATTSRGKIALDGLFVICDDEQEQNGQVVFRAHKIYGWDGYKQVYTLHFFDSDGANPPSRAEGVWENERLTLQQQTPFGLIRYRYIFDGADRYTLQIEASEDAYDWTLFTEGHYQRVAAEAIQ
ncbi:MAG: DUF1579 family protein [Caldilineaceae bacterium]